VPLNKQSASNKKSFSDRIWNFFTSLKLVIILLLILSVLSIAGTVIEQNKPLHEYYRVYQPSTVELFNKLGLFDMYHSWWFITCLAMLALNLLACTLDRYQPLMAGLRKKNLILDEKLEKTLNPLEKIKYNLPLETVETKIKELLGKNFTGKYVLTPTEDGSRHYFFEKGKYSRLAFFFTHISVLVIFIGALIGSFFGYKGYVTIFEGEEVSRVETRAGKVQNLNFTVKCNAFAVDFYPNGMPKDYRSDLTVTQQGRELQRKTIRVNDPLTVAGISFYQSSYGTLPDKVHLEIMDQEGRSQGAVVAPFGQKIAVPGTQDQLEVADYQEHFHKPDGSEGGTALGVNIYPGGGAPQGIWLLVQEPDYDRARRSPYYFRVKEVQVKRYTGLQVNKDPGEWFVWIGSLMLIGGIMAAFFLSHKKLWVTVKKDKKGRIEVAVGGTANKNRAAFIREAEVIIHQFKEIT